MTIQEPYDTETKQWTLVRGDGEWSVLWGASGEILIAADHDYVLDYIVQATGIKEIYDMGDDDWIPGGHIAIPLKEALQNKEVRNLRRSQAKELRDQSEKLLQQAADLENQ